MPITSDELAMYHSGGSANNNPSASLGGAISSHKVNMTELAHNLLDEVTGDESADGDAEYRVVYIKNDNDTLHARRVKCYFQTNEGDYLSLGLKEAADVTAGVLGSEDAAPAAVTFTKPIARAGALQIGDLDAESYRALYVRRVIPASTPANDSVSWDLVIEADTPE